MGLSAPPRCPRFSRVSLRRLLPPALLAASTTLVAGSALAQTAARADATTQPPAATPASPLSFNVGLTTDYRYRGISQSRLKPAISAGADYAHPSGFYVGTWLTSIK